MIPLATQVSIVGADTTGERPQHWTLHAACEGAAPEIFFPIRDGDTGPAKAICAHCPVAGPCLEYGMTEKYGIFGGMSEYERRRERRQRAQRRGAA